MGNERNHHGARLRTLRLTAEPALRQAALSERMGVKPSTISMIERGARGMSVGFLKQVSQTLALYLPLTAEEIALQILKVEGDAA